MTLNGLNDYLGDRFETEVELSTCILRMDINIHVDEERTFCFYIDLSKNNRNTLTSWLSTEIEDYCQITSNNGCNDYSFEEGIKLLGDLK